jgi:hypothetical protein
LLNWSDIATAVKLLMIPSIIGRKLITARPLASKRGDVMAAYIEIVSEHVQGRFKLTAFELTFIGEFTRKNIAAWLDRGNCLGGYGGMYGWEDFHAVCGDVDIPWAKEENRFTFPKK